MKKASQDTNMAKNRTFKTLWAQWNSLVVENSLLKRVWESADGKEIRKKLILPRGST